MTLFEDSKEILLRILDSNVDYDSALKSFLVTNVRNNKELKAIHGFYELFFSNYFYFETICKELLTKKTNLLVVSVGIALLSVRYYKTTINDSIEVLGNIFKNNKEKMSPEITEVITLYKDGKIYSFKDIIVGSVEHLSIMFNLPIWFIQMILSQYGKEVAKKIFLSFKTSTKKKYFYNSLVNMDKLDSNDLKEFELCDDGSYDFGGANSKLIDDNTFLLERTIYKDLFKITPKMNNKYITLYQGEKTNFYFYFLNQMLHKSNVINIALKNMSDNPEIIKCVSLKNISNLFVYKSSEGEMIAHLDKLQDDFFYVAKTTNMQKIYEVPEYRVQFKQKDIDKIIADQKRNLEEFADRIENKGYLIYVASTIDTKETSLLVDGFIKDRDNYRLISEKFFFPQKDDNSLMYFAIMQRYDHA